MPAVFWRVFAVIFLAELGDKSQLLVAAFTSEYRLREILVGTGAAIAVLCGLAVLLGTALGGLLPLTWISLVAGVAFLLFAWSGLREAQESAHTRRHGRALPAVFGTYLLAELGDKTQLATLTLSAENVAFGWAVFGGAAAALMLSALLGALLGRLLERYLSARTFRVLSFLLFTACGIVKLLEGAERLLSTGWTVVLVSVILSVFALLCGLTLCTAGKGERA